MNSQEVRYLESALEEQDSEERFNTTLAKIISERETGKSGYRVYMKVINKVRKVAKKRDSSTEEAAKYIVDKS